MEPTPFALRLDAGPDAGRSLPIPAGGLTVGRAAGPGRVADPAVEAHHVTLRPADGGVSVTQLAGRTPARVDGVAVGTPARAESGAVLEFGATRATLVEGEAAPRRPRVDTSIVLGVGIVLPDESDVAGRSFEEQAAAVRSATIGAVRLDPGIRRLLVAGPGADGVARALLEQAGQAGVRVRVVEPDEVARLRVPHAALAIAIAPDPDEQWQHGDLAPDALVVRVGVSWRAVLERAGPDGSTVVQRFHAAGRPESQRTERNIRPYRPYRPCRPWGSGRRVSLRRRLNRAFVAEQVAGAGAEAGGDVVGVPQAARCERQAPAADAPVELVAESDEQRDLFVEPRPP